MSTVLAINGTAYERTAVIHLGVGAYESHPLHMTERWASRVASQSSFLDTGILRPPGLWAFVVTVTASHSRPDRLHNPLQAPGRLLNVSRMSPNPLLLD